jgi:hypothetical protein
MRGPQMIESARQLHRRERPVPQPQQLPELFRRDEETVLRLIVAIVTSLSARLDAVEAHAVSPSGNSS